MKKKAKLLIVSLLTAIATAITFSKVAVAEACYIFDGYLYCF